VIGKDAARKETTMTKLTKILGFGAFALTIATLPAQSADRLVTHSAVVTYSDLDLSNTAGARTLYRRIENTASRLCGPANGSGLAASREYRTCVQNAVGGAVSQLNRPMVSDLHHDNTRVRVSAR
jgi:UrcA family protein